MDNVCNRRLFSFNYAYSSRRKKIYASLNGRGCEEIFFEHLEQLASPNLDWDNHESVFDRVETLYNTVMSVQWDNIIISVIYAVAK